MSFNVVDSAAAEAVAAATTQRGQLEALAAPWVGGNVTVRWLSGTTLLRTQTYGPLTISSAATPYRFTFGRFVADTHVATGAADRVVLRAGSTDIVQKLLGGTVTLAGAIKELCPPNLEGVSILATAALPADYTPMTAQQLVANGCWTWFTEPRAIYRNGKTYIGWINNTGDAGVTAFDHASAGLSSFTLRTALETDDHNNAAVYLRTDNKLVTAYCKHPDIDDIHRVRIASTAGSIAAFDAEQTLTVTDPTYSNFHYLRDTGRLFLGYREGVGTTRPQRRLMSTDEGVTWGASATWINNTGARPYYKSCDNGRDRIDFVMTTGHPRDVNSSIYHAYMLIVGGVEQFYKSDGTYIGTSINPTDATPVYDGSTVDGWVWDITYGADGHPRVLFARFPTITDHRYMYSRWTGSAWTTPVQICAAGTYLYLAEDNYSGGLCFDGNDPARVYVSVQVGSFWEIQEYRTTDDGATWAKHRDITTGSTVRNCRPWSPRGHDAKLSVLWWRGTYNTYIDYNTAIWGVG